jgi:hypothetical protein
LGVVQGASQEKQPVTIPYTKRDRILSILKALRADKRPLFVGPGPLVALALLLASTATSAVSAPAPGLVLLSSEPGASPPYLTLLFSRTQIEAAYNCRPIWATVPLVTGVAPELRRRSLHATGTLVLSLTQETARTCYADRRVDSSVVRPNAILGASWADTAVLRDSYGWTFISHSNSYSNMTTQTQRNRYSESCGTLSIFEEHGHDRADGLFAYPNNFFDGETQSVVSTCFAYGRVYGTTVNKRSGVVAPWYVTADAVNGGACNNTALSCNTLKTPSRYRSPTRLAAVVAALGTDRWFILQAYRFVSGSRAGRWDCTASDWRDHWSTSTEEYCWKDYRRILDAINVSTVTTDPKTVAEAWGRVPPY